MSLRRIEADELKKILKSHKKYIDTKGTAGVRAILRDANLSGADLSGASLYSAILRDANLSGANLSGAILRDASLRDANLSDANLIDADLYGASLYSANLRGANLRDADLRGAILRGANLIGADLSGAKTQYGILTKPVICMTLSYSVFINQFSVKIGCKDFLHDEFLVLTENDATELDGERAAHFYRTYRPLIVAAIEIYK